MSWVNRWWEDGARREGSTVTTDSSVAETARLTISRVELFESRYGLAVEQYAFNMEGGGAGRFRGGRGVVLDYRVTSEEAFLTYAASRTESRPWGLAGGSRGSTNYAQIFRNDGRVERFGMCTTVRARKGELIRLTTANGGGYGDPGQRDREAIERDLRNGYITLEQAHQEYGLKQ